MNIELWATVLMAIAPAVSAIITVICGFFALIKSVKSIHKSNTEIVIQNQEKIKALEKKLNIANSKLSSIEKFLEEKEGR